MGLFSFLFKGGTTNITNDQLLVMLKEKSKYQFVDVRTKREYKHKHILGFNKNVDYYKFKKNFSMLDRLDKEKPVVVVCETGARSASTCHLLTKLGFNDIYNVRGGFIRYKGPVAKG